MQPEWTPEQVVTEVLAKQLIEQEFTELIPVRVKRLGEGYDNTVYLVNDKYVFRFPRREVAVELIQTEHAILPLLAGNLPLPIPEPLFLGREGSSFPWPFLGYRLVDGQTPRRLPSSNGRQVAVALAEFLRVLHSFPVQKALEVGVPYDQLGRLDLAKRKPRAFANLERIAVLKLSDDVDELLHYVADLPDSSSPRVMSMVHGDLHIRNLLVDEECQVTGIIDWGDVHIGDPAIDLSIAYAILPPEERSTFFEVYGAVDKTSKDLARFKAIYTLSHLLLYSHDKGDRKQMEMAQEALHFALS